MNFILSSLFSQVHFKKRESDIRKSQLLLSCFAEMNLEEDSGLSVSCGNGKLRQWLIDQIDSRRYPGLVWENDEKSIFRIPWKHAGKQDYNREEDAALFKVRPSPVLSHCT